MNGKSMRASGRDWCGAWLAALLMMCVWPAAAAGQDELVSLRPQWHEAQSSRYEIYSQRVQHQSMTAGPQQREQRVTVRTTGEVTWRVRGVEADGGAACEMTIDWLRMTMQSEQGERVNDSRQASGDTEPLHDMLRAMTGTPIGVRVNPDGSIAGVTGTDAIRRAVQIEQMAPDDLDFIEYASKLATLISAPAEAASGNRWPVRNRWRHELGFIHEDMSWQLEGVERIAGIPVATVVGDGTLELEVDEARIPEGGPPIDVDLREGRVRTQVMFDLQRGETVGRNSVQTMHVEMAIHIPEQTVHQRIEQTVQSQALRIEEQDGR